jgi:hypothetical protein
MSDADFREALGTNFLELRLVVVQLLRITLPRNRVHKGIRKGRAGNTPALALLALEYEACAALYPSAASPRFPQGGCLSPPLRSPSLRLPCP